MKPHKILKTFLGNQTGNGTPEQFEAGTVAALSDWLAEVAVKAGEAEPVAPPAPSPKAESAPAGDAALPETRETKVVEPGETKPAAPAKKKGK